MDIKFLEKEKMDSMKALSDVSIKISEAKNLLFKLEEEETEYLVSRETKAMAKVSKVLEDSRELLDKTHQNYDEIHKFCQTITDYADFLANTHTKFQKMLELFNKKNEIWEENVKRINADLAGQRKLIEKDTEAIKTREKGIDEATESLKKEREHLESQQATLLVAYTAEQKLWDKIQRK